MDRVMKPDMQLGSPLQNRAFSGESTVGTKTSSSANSGFLGVKDARVKEYAFARSFLGVKNPWFGGKVFETKDAADLSRFLIKNADRKVTVKKAEAAGYYDGTKEANFGSPVVPVRPFIPAPAAQGAVSQITEKISNKMTIDEVRDLLNKPR